jgi:threonine synthase
MRRFRGLGAVEVPRHPAFAAARLDDDETRGVIRDLARRGYVVDPHTAVGIGAAQRLRSTGDVDPDLPTVCLATAHPAKFPDAVEQATGVRPPLPEHLADLLDRPERYELRPNDLSALQAHIRAAIATH